MTSKFLVRRTRKCGPDRRTGLGTIVRVLSGPGGLRDSELWILDLCLLLETRPPWVTDTLSHRDPVSRFSCTSHLGSVMGRDLAFEARRGQISLAALDVIPLSSCLPHPSPGCLPNKGCFGCCIPARVELLVLGVLRMPRTPQFGWQSLWGRG